jgi:hypothetical protein
MNFYVTSPPKLTATSLFAIVFIYVAIFSKAYTTFSYPSSTLIMVLFLKKAGQ